MFVSTVPWRFDDFELHPSEYQFRCYLNNRPLGEPIDFTILQATG